MTGHGSVSVTGPRAPQAAAFGELLLDLTGRVRSERACDISASVVFRNNGDAWTMRFDRGRVTIGHGMTERPDTTVSGDLDTLISVTSGREPGAVAFLDGRLAVRGNISLALRLESLFEPLVPRGPDALDDDFVRVGRHRVSVLRGGAGDEAVVMLHGLGGTKASFLPTARALAPRYRVVAPDLLGHGESAKPVGRYDPPFYSRFVLDLMDALGIERAHLIGNSMGGRIALEVSLRHPDRVRSAALLCPAVALMSWRQFVPVMRFVRPELAVVPARFPRRMLIRGMRRLFAKPERLPDSWYEAGADEMTRLWRDPRTRVAVAASLRALYLDEPHGPGGFWTRLEGIERPAMFVWGEFDPLVPARFSAHVEERLPGCSVIFEDCGHVPQFEHPDRTHGRLLDFLAAAA